MQRSKIEVEVFMKRDISVDLDPKLRLSLISLSLCKSGKILLINLQLLNLICRYYSFKAPSKDFNPSVISFVPSATPSFIPTPPTNTFAKVNVHEVQSFQPQLGGNAGGMLPPPMP